jgi:hypothetical protein
MWASRDSPRQPVESPRRRTPRRTRAATQEVASAALGLPAKHRAGGSRAKSQCRGRPAVEDRASGPGGLKYDFSEFERDPGNARARAHEKEDVRKKGRGP